MHHTPDNIKASFSNLLAKKGRYEANDILLLETLLLKYPYSQPLHLLYAAVVQENKPRFEKYLPKAAGITAHREVLFNIIHKPQNFWLDADIETSTLLDTSITEKGPAESRAAVPEETSREAIALNKPENFDLIAEYTEPAFEIQEASDFETQEAEENLNDKTEPVPAVGENFPEEIQEERFPKLESEETKAEIPVDPEAPEVEVFEPEAGEAEEKIVEPLQINTVFEEHYIETVIPDFEIPQVFEEEKQESVSENPRNETLQEEVKSEETIFDSLASADYFVFNRSSADPLKQTLTVKPSEEIVQRSLLPVIQTSEPETQEVSKYHDDKLPFTFLWWLQKTRKEHGINYQPYAPARIDVQGMVKQNIPEQLNQQIIENIFNQQVPLEEPEQVAVEIPQGKREEDLIEKFIKEEPQIRSPRSEKLDTENKARKSSEDNLDLVSETLAQIYIDQMLYHKAIDTYKKLSLKFPEKSTYFAGQISDLEKKTG